MMGDIILIVPFLCVAYMLYYSYENTIPKVMNMRGASITYSIIIIILGSTTMIVPCVVLRSQWYEEFLSRYMEIIELISIRKFIITYIIIGQIVSGCVLVFERFKCIKNKKGISGNSLFVNMLCSALIWPLCILFFIIGRVLDLLCYISLQVFSNRVNLVDTFNSHLNALFNFNESE